MSNRATRRRLRGKREALRDGIDGVGMIIKLRAQGYSAETIATQVPVSQQAVSKILAILEGGLKGPEGEGGVR